MGHSEDCSLGDSISDVRETAKLWETAPKRRSGWGRSVYMWIWMKGDTCNQTCIFPEGFYQSHEALASHEEQASPWRILVLSELWGDTRIEFIKLAPENFYLRTCPASFFPSIVSSVTQLCPTLCDPTDCSMPGFPVHHQLPELAQTHVHRVSDAIQPAHLLLSPSPPAFNLSQHQGIFWGVSSLHQVATVLEFQLQHQSFQWICRIDFL